METTASVCIQKASYESMDLDALLAPLGSLSSFVSRGDRVLLKVNLLSATTPDRAVVTHPALVRAVARAVQQVGGVPVIGDSPSGPLSKRRLGKVYERAGLVEVSKDLGVELNYDTGHRKVPIPNGAALASTPLCTYFLDADVTISLPKIKTHSFQVMTLAAKNMFGAVPGLTKAKFHSLYMRKAAFADMILDVLSVATPDLVIMDGILGMEGDGPGRSGTPVSLGTLLASTDSLAVDLAVCRMLALEPVGIPVLRQARLRGLLPSALHFPLLTPEDVMHSGYQLPLAATYLLTGENPPSRYPVATDGCTGCKACEEICPKGAIVISKGTACVDKEKCIRCYCCQEACPEGAIVLQEIR